MQRAFLAPTPISWGVLTHFAGMLLLCVQGTKVNSRGKEVPHGVRLYSIASSRYGDSFDGNTTSLCVRRATYWDPEMNADDPAKASACILWLHAR